MQKSQKKDPPTLAADTSRQDGPDYRAIYQRLTESLPGLVYRIHIRQNNRMEFLNGQASLITGYTGEELSGGVVCGIAPLIHPDDREHVAGEVERALAADRPFSVEYRLRHKDGGLRYLLERGLPVSGEDGKPQFIDGVIFDITARRRTEERLHRQNLLNEQIIDSAGEGIIVYGQDLRYLTWNPCMERISGRKASEVLGRHPLEAFPFLQEAGIIDRLEKTLRGETCPPIEFLAQSGTATAGWSSDSCSPLRNAKGEIIGVIGIVRDITERKQADIALKNSENMLKAIIDAEPECVKLLDAEGRLILMNRAGLDMLEVDTLEQVKGQCVCPLIVDLHWDAFMGLTKRVFQGESGILVFEMVGVKGRHLWLETHAVPFRNERDEVVALLGITRDITARREAETALRQSREKFRTLYDETPALLHSIDRFGVLIDVNKHWLKIMGYKRDEVIGRKVTDFYTESSRQYAVEVVQPAFFRDGFCKDVPFQFVKKSGELLDVLLSANGERDADGNVIRSRAVIEDITERKLAEEQLRQSESTARALLNIPTAAAFLLNREGICLDANDTLARRFGKSVADIVGKSIWELFPPDVAERRAAHFQGVLQAKKLIRYEDERQGMWNDSIIAPIFDKNGEVARVAVMGFDITERKRAEEQLRQNEQLIRSILDNVDEGFIVLDREFRIMTANKAYRRLANDAGADVVGRHCYEVAHRRSSPCHKDDEKCVIKQVFKTGKPGIVIHTHEDDRGGLRHVETRGFPLLDAAGNLTSAIEVIHDVTDRYRLEAEQIKTQKLEAIGALAGGIAHDFNNLLQGIFGYLSMAKLAIDNKDEALQALEQAEKALALSTKLTMQLLTFSKGGKPVKKRGDISAIIDNSAKFALSGSSCDCRLQMADDLWQAEIDEGQIAQVIQNIVLNAAQAMVEGGRIEITARNVQAPGSDLPSELAAGDYLAIAISDNGPGIPAQHLAKIFDPYFTTKADGSGLGLATSYSIIKNHDGLIDVRSETGSGTTFWLYLPAIREANHEEQLKEAAPVAAAAAQRTGKILLMDDDQVIRDVAGQLIKAIGHEVTFAVHGEEAIAKYRLALESGTPFDIVILDLTIRGGMGGFDTIRHLQALNPGIKAVVSSGYSDDSTLSEYRKLGFISCLHKPYSLKELKNTLNVLI